MSFAPIPLPARPGRHAQRSPAVTRVGCLVLALVGIALALALSSRALSQDGYVQAPLPASDARDAARELFLQPQDLFLEIFHDERPIGRLGHVRLRQGRISATADELQAIGLILPAGSSPDADGWIALDTLPGLTYRYDPARQHLYLSIPASLRPTQALGYQPPEPVQAQRDSGWLLGYDSYGRLLGDDYSLALGHTLRRFGPAGALETRGSIRAGDSGSGYRRLDSFWIYSDPERLWTWTAGDLISGGLPWTRPVRMAGFQWRRNFAVRPDLVTLPMPRFSADATVPSAVDLYLNNIRQFGSRVQDGPFVLDALPRISGAGQATVVVTDHLGRTTQTSVPLYVDQQRLAPGLTDFSVEAGVLRHGYGSDQDRYRGSVAASASGRRGITNTLTLEGHGEAASGLRMAGLGAVWSPAGRWGLLTGAYARSDSEDRQGSQYSLGYQWYSERIGLDLQRLRRDAGFRDLGDLERQGSLARPWLMTRDRATAWLPLPRGSLSGSWLRQGNGEDDTGQIIRSLSWNQIFGQQLSVSATVFDSDGDRGVGISLSRSFGDRLHGHAQVSHDDTRNSGQIGLRRSAPYQGGWGWDLRAGHHSGANGQASVQVLGRHGEAWFGIDRTAGGTGAFFQGNGSVAAMDGRLFLSRYIHDGFAVASTGGIADVQVLSENRPLGRSDAAGYLLVPDLRSWQRNHIAIDPNDLGPDYRIGQVARTAIPADRSGVLVRFEIERNHPVLLVLIGRDGEPVAAGRRGRIVASGERVVVGYDGQVFLDNLVADTTIEVAFADGRCLYHVAASQSSSDSVPRRREVGCQWKSP